MLIINCEYRLGVLFVRLKGILNKETISKMKSKVIYKIMYGGIRHIVFNFEGLEDIDIRGINSLLYCYELCHRNDGFILICGNNDYVKNKLKKYHIFNYMYETSNEVVATKIFKMRVK